MIERGIRIKEQALNALALSTLDAPEPTPETMELIEQYIQGNMELEYIKMSIIESYQEKANEQKKIQL